MADSHGITANPAYIELDKKVFLEIRKTLCDDSGSMKLVRYHDYAGSFRTNAHTDLHAFIYRCKSPDFEFMDIDLEALRARLADEIEEFLALLGEHAFTLPGRVDISMLRPPPEKDMEFRFALSQKAKDEEHYQELVSEATRLHWKVAEEANSLSTRIWNTYAELIRLGRRKLGV